MRSLIVLLTASAVGLAQPYDLLLKGGHVIDPANYIDHLADVAITGNRISMVAPNIAARSAKRVIEVKGLYVTPGLVDLHTHVYVKGRSATVLPDDAVLPHGTTTVVDAGVSGWRNFEDFRETVILKSKTRVLAFLNIVGSGMHDDQTREFNVNDMDPRATAEMVRTHPGILVGVKTAHFGPPGWAAVERAIEAGRLSGTPAMLDSHVLSHSNRTTRHKLLHQMRPGDLHTHTYNDRQIELLDRHTGKVQPWMWEARQRGVLFDLGHGAGSFLWPLARTAIAEGFPVDTISTDLHTGSILTLQVNMASSISKLMALGMTLTDAIRRSTANPAKAIGRLPQLGTLGKDREADVAVFELREGVFAYPDSSRKKLTANRKLECVMTIRAGDIVFDRDARALPESNLAARLAPLPEALLAPRASPDSNAIFDILLRQGQVIDPANKRFGRFDIAIVGKKIARIAPHIAPVNARMAVDVSAYYVTPGLIDLGAAINFLDSSTDVQPDHHSLPHGVTVVAAAGVSPEVVRRSRVHILPLAPSGPIDNLSVSGINRTAVLTQHASMTRTLTLRLNQGAPLMELIEGATLRAARALNQPALGALREGAAADLAVFQVEHGSFPMPDNGGKRFTAKARVVCVLTLLGGDPVWDLHGLTMREWTQAGPYSNYR